MFCAISGQAPEKAVVSKITGHVYEASLLEKYLTAEGKVRAQGMRREVRSKMSSAGLLRRCLPPRAVFCGPLLARRESSIRGARLSVRVWCSVRSLAKR